MKKQNNAGFSLVEVLLAMVILAAIVIPVCSGILVSVQVNTRAEDVLQARLAVSSAIETLTAQGITYASEDYGVVEQTDLFPNVKIITQGVLPAADSNESAQGETTPEETMPTHYTVTVQDNRGLVTVTTKIRAAEPIQETEPDTTVETTAPTDEGGAG